MEAPTEPIPIDTVAMEKYPFYHKEDEEKKSGTSFVLDLPPEKRRCFCDPTQLNEKGEYRYPKITAEMIKAKMKERENIVEENQKLKTTMEIVVEHAREQEGKLDAITAEFAAYRKLTEERFEKLTQMFLNQ